MKRHPYTFSVGERVDTCDGFRGIITHRFRPTDYSAEAYWLTILEWSNPGGANTKLEYKRHELTRATATHGS